MSNDDKHILAEWLVDKSSIHTKEAINQGFDINNIEHHLDYIDKHPIPTDDVDQSWAQFQQRLVQQPSANQESTASSPIAERPRRYLWLIIGLLALVSSIYYWYSQTQASKAKLIKQEYNAEIAEVEKIETPDKSIITLAPKSALHYFPNRWPNEREIWLDGRAYFEVAKGSTFDVKTDKGMVTVLGTKFEVISSDTALNVVCVEGIVSVAAPSANSKIIKAGEKIILKGESFGQVIKHTQADMAWKNKELAFDAATLSAVTSELSLYYPNEINIHPSLSSKRFTGVLPANDLAKALEILAKTFSIIPKKGSDGSYMLM